MWSSPRSARVGNMSRHFQPFVIQPPFSRFIEDVGVVVPSKPLQTIEWLPDGRTMLFFPRSTGRSQSRSHRGGSANASVVQKGYGRRTSSQHSIQAGMVSGIFGGTSERVDGSGGPIERNLGFVVYIAFRRFDGQHEHAKYDRPNL